MFPCNTCSSSPSLSRSLSSNSFTLTRVKCFSSSTPCINSRPSIPRCFILLPQSRPRLRTHMSFMHMPQPHSRPSSIKTPLKCSRWLNITLNLLSFHLRTLRRPLSRHHSSRLTFFRKLMRRRKYSRATRSLRTRRLPTEPWRARLVRASREDILPSLMLTYIRLQS